MSTRNTGPSGLPSRRHRVTKNASPGLAEFNQRHALKKRKSTSPAGAPASLPKAVRQRASRFRSGKHLPNEAFATQVAVVSAELLAAWQESLPSASRGGYADGFLAGIQMHKVFCSMGYKVEDLFRIVGENVIEQEASNLVALRTGAEFLKAIKALQGSPSRGVERDSMCADLAAEFFVAKSYVKALVRDENMSVRYPDLVSLFDEPDGERLVLAEAKIGGRNDCKSVEANVEKLVSVKSKFRRPGRRTETVVTLAFSDARRQNNAWRKYVSHADRRKRLDHVAVDADAWSALAGVELTPDQYQRARAEVVVTAAEMMALDCIERVLAAK